MTTKMRVVQIPTANGPFELVDREIPAPSAGMVRVKVQACGICHSDQYAKEGSRPGIQYPRIPGHEIAGNSAIPCPRLAKRRETRRELTTLQRELTSVVVNSTPIRAL